VDEVDTIKIGDTFHPVYFSHSFHPTLVHRAGNHPKLTRARFTYNLVKRK